MYKIGQNKNNKLTYYVRGQNAVLKDRDTASDRLQKGEGRVGVVLIRT